MAVVFVGIGVAAAVYGVKFWFGTRSFLARAVRTGGLIVDFKRERSASSRGGGSSVVYYPIFRFTAPDGRAVVQRAQAGSSHPRLRPGDAVTVLFDPQDPEQARIDSIGNRGPLTSVMIIGFGIVFAGAGVWMFVGGSG